MRRPSALCLPLLLAAAVLAGCSDDDGGSDAASSSSSTSASSSAAAGSTASGTATGTAAVCSSLDALQDSVAALADVPVRDGGIDAVQAAFGTVQDDADQVVSDAQEQYGEQADRLSADVSAVGSALADAASDPSAATLQAVGSAIATLVSDVTSFAGDVGSTC